MVEDSTNGGSGGAGETVATAAMGDELIHYAVLLGSKAESGRGRSFNLRGVSQHEVQKFRAEVKGDVLNEKWGVIRRNAGVFAGP